MVARGQVNAITRPKGGRAGGAPGLPGPRHVPLRRRNSGCCPSRGEGVWNDESAEVQLKHSTGGRKDLLVVVRELNDDPISGVQRVNQRQPTAIRDETPCAATIRRVVHNHRGVFEELREQLSQPCSGFGGSVGLSAIVESPMRYTETEGARVLADNNTVAATSNA